jgi:hypothetical protein
MTTNSKSWASFTAMALGVSFLLGACGGAEKPPATEPAPAEAPAESPVTVGEVVISQNGQPVFKLHADGTSELAQVTATGTSWVSGPTLRADGTIIVEGAEKARIGTSAITFASGESFPVAGEAGTIVIGEADKQVTVTIDAAGAVTLVGGPASPEARAGWKVEAADPAASRSAMLLWLSIMAGPTAETATEPKTETVPVPAPKTP